AHVAGCAALIRSIRPDFNPDQVEQVLRATAVDLGTPGRDDFYGSGRLNCASAMLAASGTGASTPTATPTTTSTTPRPTATATSAPAPPISCAGVIGLSHTEMS